MDRQQMKKQRNDYIKQESSKRIQKGMTASQKSREKSRIKREARKKYPLRRQRREFYSKKDGTKKEFLTKKRR